ncbi:MAG: hypothetical protein Q4D33_12640 [Prevotellaceae bacterium]|nr:hypothetical protein [Prevotellaceae bacterium]
MLPFILASFPQDAQSTDRCSVTIGFKRRKGAQAEGVLDDFHTLLRAMLLSNCCRYRLNICLPVCTLAFK